MTTATPRAARAPASKSRSSILGDPVDMVNPIRSLHARPRLALVRDPLDPALWSLSESLHACISLTTQGGRRHHRITAARPTVGTQYRCSLFALDTRAAERHRLRAVAIAGVHAQRGGPRAG